MTFFPTSGNSYSYFDDAEGSRGGYEFSEVRSRPYDFEMLPPQNLDEYLIDSFSGSFGLASLASDTSELDYDTLALVSRRGTNTSGSYGQRKKNGGDAKTPNTRKPSTPGAGAYDVPATYFTDFLEAVPSGAPKTPKRNSAPPRKVGTPTMPNTTPDTNADFKFGMQAFLHSQQLGFGRQASFRRADDATPAPRRADYYFGFDENPPASGAVARGGRRGSNASRGQSTPATAIAEQDMYKKWMDTLESSNTNRLESSTASRSSKPTNKPSRSPQTSEGTAIAPEFKREVDFLMRGILGDIDVASNARSDAHTTPNYMWTNLDSFLSGSIVGPPTKPPGKTVTASTGAAVKAPTPVKKMTTTASSGPTSKNATSGPVVRNRPRVSSGEARVATVHYAFPEPNAARKAAALRQVSTTVEDYFVDPSWVNGDATPLSRSASIAENDADSAVRRSAASNSSSNRLSIRTDDDSGPTPSREPIMPTKSAQQTWKRIPKPQVTTSTSRLVIASIPTNDGLGALQRSPTKDSTPKLDTKQPSPQGLPPQPPKSSSLPAKRGSATSGKTPRTPGDPLSNMEYPSAEGLRGPGGDVNSAAMPFFPSSSSDVPLQPARRESSAPPHGILSRPSGTNLQSHRTSVRTDRADSVTPSQTTRRRLSEFKNAAGDGALATSFSVSRTEDVAAQRAAAAERQRAAQKANEERKERVQAFLARRKKEKEDAEKERLRQKETREKERSKPASAAAQRAKNNDTPPAGSAANAVRGKQRTSLVKPEPPRQSVRQSLPAAPYLEGDGILHTQNDSMRDVVTVGLSVRSVLVSVTASSSSSGSNKSAPNGTLSAKDTSTVELRYRRDSPRFFNVDEFLQFDKASGQNLSSMTLSEMVRKFLAGTNAALLLSSTPQAEAGVEAAVTEVVSAVMRHRPASAQMYLSVCVLQNGMTADVCASPETALTPSTFAHSPTYGSVVENVGYELVQSAREVSKWMTAGIEKAAQARQQNRNAMLVVSFILKQVKDKDIVLSSLLLTDAPCDVYAQVLRKTASSPYQLFHGVLGGPSFTAAMFCVTAADDDVVQTLNTHHKLTSITNKPTHLGSLSAFKKLAEKDLSQPATHTESGSSKSSRHLQLRYWVDEVDKALKNPAGYTPRRTAAALAKTAAQAKKNSASAVPTAPVRPVQKPRPVNTTAATSPNKDSKRGSALATHSSASMLTPKFSAQCLPSEGYINRGGTNAVTYGKSGGVNLYDSPSTANPLSGANTGSRHTSNQAGGGAGGTAASMQKALPGATTVNADGPAWPSEKSVKAIPPLVPTRSATEDAIITVASISGSSFSSDASAIDRRPSVNRHASKTTAGESMDDEEAEQRPATRVRTMVVVDPRCKESSNVTFENNMVIATTEDDFEEYDVDEVLEMGLASKDIKSSVLDELCETVMSGCNAALLSGDSRSYAASPLVLKTAVRRILSGISQKGAKRYGNLSVSIVRVKGKTMTDLLVPKSEPKKLVVAISPIFGSCVHGVEFKQVTTAAAFDGMLKRALDTVVGKNEREVSFICCSFILKLKLEEEKDVLVSSLVAFFAGENVGLYASVLDQSPLVPRALFHYALGGPCFTVSLLGIGGDETRANTMLQVQRSLGLTNNRITHPGSISKFVGGIRNELAPAMMQKLKHGESESERSKTQEILTRLTEIVKDAEALLRDFDNHEPKAYLNSDEDKNDDDEDEGTHAAPTPKAAQKRRSLPNLVVKSGTPSAADATSEDDTRIQALVCLEERMMGGGSVTASDGAAVFVKTRTGGMRFDADEVVIRNSSTTSLDSTLIDNLVNRFLSGHHTGLVTADSSNCAFNPLMLRKIVYQIVGLMRTGLPNAPGSKAATPICGELRVSMALIKDGLIADLLPIEEDAEVQPFSVEYNPIAGPVLASVVGHLVPSAEDFDRFFAIAIDNAEPSLQTEDPGIMVVSLALTQRVTEPKEDVLVSSLLCTAVFDAVQHYTAVLAESPEEPLDLFRFILGGASYTVALMGVCDEDEDPMALLNVLNSLRAVRNRPSHPNSVAKYISDLQQSIVKLHEVMAKTSKQDEKNYIKSRLDLAEQMLREAETVLRYPLSFMNVQQQNQLTFVPLGS